VSLKPLKAFGGCLGDAVELSGQVVIIKRLCVPQTWAERRDAGELERELTGRYEVEAMAAPVVEAMAEEIARQRQWHDAYALSSEPDTRDESGSGAVLTVAITYLTHSP